MQAENQVTRLNNISHFPWVKVIKKKFFRSFPEIKARTLLLLHQNISKEFEEIRTNQNRTRARAFYMILRELYLHLCWKIDWNIECHIKSTCVLILYCMSYTGLILSKGNVSSEWFSEIFTAFQFLSGDPFLVCDALLLFQNMKKKYHHAYSEILKSWLFDGRLRKPSNSECFVKVMLLFRRLKFLSKGAAAKSKITLYSSKVECPPGVESWLSSLKIKDLCNIKSNKIIQKFFKKDLSCGDIKRLQAILFAKYDERFINLYRAASIQQNITKIKKTEKKFDKKSEKGKKAKPNADAYKLEIDLNNEINPKNYKNHSDYQCFNLARRNFNEENSTYVSALSENPASLSRMPKRKFFEKEEIDETCLDSISVSQKSKKRKVYNKRNDEYKESNPKHSTLLDVKISDQSVTDSVNKLREKGENTLSILIVDGKNSSNETGKQTSSETPDQFFMCSSKPEDLQSYPVENESLVSCNLQGEKQKSDNLSVSKESCKSKRVITENCYENGNNLNFDTPIIVFRKDKTLDVQRTNKQHENSTVMPNTEKSLIINSSSSTDLVKNNIDFSATDKSNLLSVQLQGHEIMQTDISQNNVTDIHKNNLEILNKRDHIPSSDIHNDNRPLTVLPDILNTAESDCENELVNYLSCVNNAKLVTSDHSQASITQNKEVQNSAESPIIISPLKSYISQETFGNCFQLYSSENTRNQDTRIVSMLSPPLAESFEKVYSSPESLELSIASGPSVPSSIVKSLELSKSIYTTTDSSLKYTDEDEPHISDGKGIPSKLSQHNSNSITSKISESKLSTKKSRRKRVKSKKFVESSGSSSNESSLKKETPKTVNSSNCEVERFSDVLSSESNAESFNKRSSLSLSSKNKIIDSRKHLVDRSAKRKQVLQDLTSKCETDLFSNHLVEEENGVPCLEHINISNPSKTNDKSSEVQTERPKSLSTAVGNVTQSMHLPQSIFAADENSLLPADSACTFETLDMLHSASRNELQKGLAELNNLPFSAQKSVRKQMDNSKNSVHQVVSPLGNKLLKLVSDDKFDNFANVQRASSPIEVKEIFDDVHNSNKRTSDFLLQNEQISQDYENSIVKVNNSEMSLNNSLTVIPDQGSPPEVQNSKQNIILNNVQIVLSDCLASQSYPVSPYSKAVTENLVSPIKDKSATSDDSTSKQKKIGKQKKKKFVFDSDSDAPEDQKSLQAKCFSRSKSKKSIDSSKEQKLSRKVKYKRCIVESESDASIHENGLHDSTVSQESPSQKEIKSKDTILESTSDDNSDHSEYSEVNPKDFIFESAYEDNDCHSECSSEILPSEVSHSSFIVNSASEDDSDSDESTCSSRSSSSSLRSFENNKAKNLTMEAKTQGNVSNLLSLSRSPSPELKPSKKVKCISDSSSEDNADKSVSSSKSSLPKLKQSYKVKPKTYVLESASEDNANESLSPSRTSSPDFTRSNKIKSKTLVLKSASEDSADDSVVFSRSQSLELKHHNKVKPQTLVSTKDNANSISSPSSHFPLLKTSNIALDDNFDSSHDLNISPVKQNCSKENIYELPDCLHSAETLLQPEKEISRSFRKSNYLLRNSSNKEGSEKSFSEIKKSIKANKFKEVGSINSENSLVNLSSRKIRKNSGPKELDKNCVVPSKKRGRRKSKKIVSESESDSCENRCEDENKSDASHISSKNLTPSYNHLTNLSRNSNLHTNSAQINYRTELVSSVEGQKNLDVSEIDVHSSTSQAFSTVNKKSNVLRNDTSNRRSVRRELSFESESSSDDIPLIEIQQKLKASVNSPVSPENPNSFSNCDKSLLNVSSDCTCNSEKDSYISKHSPLLESSCSIDQKENLELSKTSQNSSVNQLPYDNDQNTAFISDKGRQELSLKETSFESTSDLLSDEIKKKNSEFMHKCQKVLELQQNLHLEATKENLPSLKQLKNSVIESHLEQSFVNNSSICSSENGNQLPYDNDQNTFFISDNGRQELSLKETSFESRSDLLSDEIKKKNSEVIHKCQKVLELQQNPQLGATEENLPSSKELKNSVVEESHLEQSFVNNSSICSSENGNQLPYDNDQNTSFISDNGSQELLLKETSFESTSDLLNDENKKKNSEVVHKCQKVLELQQNPQLGATKENLPSLKQLKNSVIGSHLEQSFVNNSSICSSGNGNLFPNTLSNLNNLPPSGQESNSSSNVENGHQLLEVDKNVCDLFFSEKEHLPKDSFHDSNCLSDENFVQTLLDKIDPNILNNEDYLNSFVDNYLVSSGTHTALNENIENSNYLKSKSFNNSSSLFNSVIPYSNTVNKSNQQNSEPIFSTSNNETFDFHKTEGTVIDSKIMDFDAVDVQNIKKNDCLNSNLDPNQTLEENNSHQPPIQCVDGCSNTELQQLDLNITPTEEINVTKNSDTFIKHLQQNSGSPYNLPSLITIPTLCTHCAENKKMVKPHFCEMDIEETSPDRLNTSLNSKTLMKELQKDVGYGSKLNLLNQDHSNNFKVDTHLNTSKKLQIMQEHLSNTTDANEKILFICDIENKTCQVHIMPQQLMVTFLSKMGNVSQNHTLCSNSTKCNCPLCCYSSSAEFKDEELSKHSDNTRTEMGHICVNGVKLSTSSLFPVVNLGKRCDEKEQNSIVEKDCDFSASNKVSQKKQRTIKKQCLVKSNSKSIVPENCHRRVHETGQNSFCKKENDLPVVKKESIPKRSYNLRNKKKTRHLSCDEK